MMFIWQPDDPLYILLQTVKEYIILFLGITFLIGWVFITYYFISKPLRYLDEVVVATEQLVVPSMSQLSCQMKCFMLKTN